MGPSNQIGEAIVAAENDLTLKFESAIVKSIRRRKWPSTTGTTMKSWEHENLAHQLNKALDQEL
jgi:hypothetical protein